MIMPLLKLRERLSFDLTMYQIPRCRRYILDEHSPSSRYIGTQIQYLHNVRNHA